jgi:aspartate-semialdehyde dehydrogenase
MDACAAQSLTFLQATGRLQAFPEQALALQQLAYLRLDQKLLHCAACGDNTIVKAATPSVRLPEELRLWA